MAGATRYTRQKATIARERKLPTGIVVPILYHEIFRRTPVHYDVGEQIRCIPREMMLRWISGINCIIRNQPDSTDPKIQRTLLAATGSGLWYHDQVLEFIAAGRTLFFLEQLAVLGKFALLKCDGDKIPKNFMDRFFRSALAVSELRTNEVGTHPDAAPADFISLEIAGTFGFEDPLPNNLLIFHSFFEWAEGSEAKKSVHYLPIADDFVKHIGMSWKDHLAAGYAVWAYFRRINSPETVQQIAITFRPDDFMKAFKERTALERWFDLNTWTFDEITTEFAKDTLPHFIGAWLYPLKRKPLFLMPSGQACCVHLPFLENSMAPGIFYKLVNAYQNVDENLSRRCRSLFGNFFEDYVALLFERIAAPRQYPIFREVDYGDGLKSSDCVFFDGNNAVFVEMVWSRFKQIETLVELDPRSIDEDLDRIIKKIRQLNRNIIDFKAGRYKLGDIDPTTVRNIYPIIVTSFALPHFVGIVSHIKTAIDAEDLLVGCEPLVITEVQALDLLEPDLTTKISLVDLMNLKKNHRYGRNMSLMNFVAIHGDEFGLSNVLPKPHSILRIQDELQAICNNWGGPKFVPA